MPQAEQPQKPQQELIDAVNQVMPFGKYQGRRLLELPEPYLVWFHKEGFPDNKLGRQLALIYEVKLNGLEGMLKPLLKRKAQRNT
ncbi:DUF3820 family protein [Kangiella sp.]|uniref:DUF3820 family protein n=1 Tax=Kangiella sp. TaxID=1920245 RepID=UPI0019AA2022|nr:DUF3820 family protein [Kangiella sp.]MBD3653310.1 DUF3820 family protein [Kangiella sp.]